MAVTEGESRAMTRAIELAANGPRGINPQVGSVILSPDGTVLAEGWHRGAGTAHAEVDALRKLTPEQTAGATAVVTMEPCNHTGRTGPCSLALIQAGVARVVYALDDPGAVSGGGAERLRAAGVEVETGEQADAVMALVGDWLTVQRLNRPHVTVKWAQSLDGRAAASDGSSQWITGPDARADVHRRRSLADAIVVGTGTVLADDPALTARRADGALYDHQPMPVVLGRRGIPTGAAVHRHPLPVLQHDGQVLFDEDDDSSLLAVLREQGVQRVFVEGGPTVASAFLRAGLADEILAYVAPVVLGGDRLALGDLGVTTIADARRLTLSSVVRLGEDTLYVASPVRTGAPHEAHDSEHDRKPEEGAS